MLRIALYDSERDNQPRSVDVTWEELCELLAECPEQPSKHGPAWSPVDIVDGGSRRNADVRGISALVLDFDHLSDTELEDDARALEGVRHVAHATHSDKPGDHCIRVVIPLDTPIPRDAWPEARAALLEELGVRGVDAATADPARLYFLPSRPVGTTSAERLYCTGDGRILSTEKFQKIPPKPSNTIKSNSEENLRNSISLENKFPPASVALIRHAADFLERHGPAVEGAGGDKHTYVAGCYLLHDLGLSWDEAKPLALAWNRSCQPPWDEVELKRKLENGLDYAKGAFGAKRVDLELGERLAAKREASPVDRVRAALVADVRPDTSELYGPDLRDFALDGEAGIDEPWLVKGIIPAGLPQVIVGRQKSMKTFLAEHVALCIASGKKWLDSYETKRARVLLLPQEDSLNTTRRRLWRLARGLGFDLRELHEWLRVNDGRGFRFDKDEDLKRMISTLEVWKPELVIIDSLSRTHIGDENSVKEMLQITNTWQTLCVEFGVAILLLHHVRKNTGEATRFGDRMRGTGELFAMARHVIGVEMQDGAIHVTLEGNLSDLPEPFVIGVCDGLDGSGKKTVVFSRQGESRDVRVEALIDKVITCLSRAGGETYSMRELCTEVGGNAEGVRAVVKKLAREGRIGELKTAKFPRYFAIDGKSA